MHHVKSILIGLFLGLIILFGITITVTVLYEDEVSQYLVEELNELILSEIEVEEVNFSLIKKFPKATLEFKNVVAYSKSGYLKTICGFETDTLFYAKRVYIQLNLLDILKKEYNVQSIHLDRGNINLFIDRFGDPNYIFWNQSAEKDTDDFKLELKKVRVTNSRVLFCNEATQFILDTYTNKIDFQGNFSKQNYLMKVESDLWVNKLQVNEIIYLNNKSLNADFDMDIINKNIQIENGRLKLADIKFEVNGNIDQAAKRQHLDLLISGKGLDLKSFNNALPQVIKDEFPLITAQKGEITVKLNIAGEDIKTKNPHIDAMFLIHNAQLFDEKRFVRISDISVDGEFTNGNLNSSITSKLVFKSFSANMERNSVSGSFELKNLKEPEINLDIQSQLYFDEIKEILEIDTLEVFKGYAQAEIKYVGSYSELRSFTFPDLFTKDYELNLKIREAQFKLINNPIEVYALSGNIELRNSLYADSLYFKINNNDFLVNGRISKLFEYFNDKQIFNVNAKIQSNRLDLNELSPLFKVNNTQQNNSSYQFPDKISLQLKLDIRNFQVGKFSATNIYGNLNYKPRMFSLHEISFESMNGDVKAGGVIIQKFNNDFVVKTQSRLNNINMNKLFYSFNNFGQQFITSQNLQGNLTGDVFFNSEWSDQIKIYKNTVSSDCDIVIKDGELNDFEPMMALSRFIDIDELKNIKFSTIENKITIKDERIIIPQMDISSSVLDVTASGEHHFDHSYNYHFRLLLSDLLSSKMKRSKRKRIENNDYEEDQDGRMIVYLLLTGDQDDFKVRYDRKTARSVRKENMKSEQNELKKILNEEFGWYKQDSAINKTNDSQPADQIFKVDFEENRINRKKDSIPDQKFQIEWEEDTSQNG